MIDRNLLDDYLCAVKAKSFQEKHRGFMNNTIVELKIRILEVTCYVIALLVHMACAMDLPRYIAREPDVF